MLSKEEKIAILTEELNNLLKLPSYDKNKVRNLRRKITFLTKYGVECISKSSVVKQKRKATNLAKYGRVNGNGFGSKYSNKTMNERYQGTTTFESDVLKRKYKDTMKSRYKVDNPSKSSYIRTKKKLSYIAKYGVDNPSKSGIVKLKKKLTRISNKNK